MGFNGLSSAQKPTNSYKITYQASSSHQVPKTWVKQHPKTPQPTKTNENPSPSYLHAQIGSYLVYIHSSDCYYQLYKVYLTVHMHMHCFQDRFKDVQVGSRWFSYTVHPLTKLSHPFLDSRAVHRSIYRLTYRSQQLRSELIQLSSRHVQLRFRLIQLSHPHQCMENSKSSFYESWVPSD